MKTVIKAALLLSGSIFLSQASLAGKPSDECTFEAKADACATALEAVDIALKEARYDDAFKNDRDYFGLTCKLAVADLKIDSGKASDAERKLSDSVYKIQTLSSQGKLEPTAAMSLEGEFEAARQCAEDLGGNK